MTEPPRTLNTKKQKINRIGNRMNIETKKQINTTLPNNNNVIIVREGGKKDEEQLVVSFISTCRNPR
jgi:hypothetical protein